MNRLSLCLWVSIVLQSSALLQSAAPSSGTLPGGTSKVPSKPSPAEQQNQQEAQKKKLKAEKAVRNLLQKKVQELQGKRVGPQEQFSEALSQEGHEYPYPGVVLYRNDTWEGSDNVYKISDHIAVGVDLDIPPPGSDVPPLPISEEAIRNRVQAIFKSADITPYAANMPDLPTVTPGVSSNYNFFSGQGGNIKPPLPLFMVVIIAQPINKGYVFYCAANLFEDVDVKRITLSEGVMQAITWERQHLIVTPTEEIPYHLNRCIDDLAYSFVKVYRYFQNVRTVR